MKIVILGAGALGSVLGCKLAKAGNNVTMVDVVPELIETVQKQHGFMYDSPDWCGLVPVKVCCYDALETDMDLVILLTKSYHSYSALNSVQPFLSPDTYVMTLQNGLGNVERVAEYVPMDHILVGTTLGESNLVGYGHIHTSGSAPTVMMSADGIMRDIVKKVCDVFNEAGIETTLGEDIMASIWEKVAFNCATNTMASVCRLCDKYTLGTEETRELAFNIARDTCKVANAAGINANADNVIHKLSTSYKIRGDHFPSMAQDVFSRRRTEIDSINGAVYKKARELGIEVPYVETMYRLVRCIESNYPNQHLVCVE